MPGLLKALYNHYYRDIPYDHFIDHSHLSGKHARELPVRHMLWLFLINSNFNESKSRCIVMSFSMCEQFCLLAMFASGNLMFHKFTLRTLIFSIYFLEIFTVIGVLAEYFLWEFSYYFVDYVYNEDENAENWSFSFPSTGQFHNLQPVRGLCVGSC